MKKKTRFMLGIAGISVTILVLAVIILFNKKDSSVEGTSYGWGSFFFATEGVVAGDKPLRFFDVSSRQTYILCRIPNCDHARGNAGCEAWTDTNYAMIYDGKLFYFRTSTLESELWVRELAGSGERKLMTGPYRPKKTVSVIAAGKLYCFATEPIDEYGMERSKDFIIEINLETGDYRRITKEEPYEEYQLGSLKVIDGMLYYSCENRLPGYGEMVVESIKNPDYIANPDELEKLRETMINKVDLKTLEKTDHYYGEGYDISGVCGDEIIILDTKDLEILAVDKSGNERVLTKVQDKYSFGIYPAMGDYVSYSEGEARDITVFLNVKTDETYKRQFKSSGGGFLYNDTLDSVFSIINQNKDIYQVIKMEDFVAGNYADYQSLLGE